MYAAVLKFESPLTKKYIQEQKGYERRKKLRILLKNGCKCKRCSAKENLTIDHIIPRSKGKKKYNHINTQVLCVKCHMKKNKDGN